MKTTLAEAIIQLLPHINAVLAAHDPKQPARRSCHRCQEAICNDCAEFWLAASALDLVICARRVLDPNECDCRAGSRTADPHP